MKKFLALVLVTVLTLSLSANVFAAENGDIECNEEFVVHSINLEIEPGGISEISPYMYGEHPASEFANVQYSVKFPVAENRFAFETSGTSSGAGNFITELCVYSSTFPSIASLSNTLNSGYKKLDNIPITPNREYIFRITNYSTSPISVHIKYYSW